MRGPAQSSMSCMGCGWRSAERRRGAWVVASASLCLLVLDPAGTAAAHASIEEIVPSDGALLAVAPAELTVRFSEAITEQFIAARLLTTESSGGTSLDAVRVREVELIGHRDPTDDHRLVVLLPAVTDGLYQVRFEVRDREDLHQVAGRTSFAVGAVAAPAPLAATSAPPSALESAFRWVFASGLVLLAGVLTFRGRWPDIPIGRPRRLTALAGAGLLAVLVGRLGVASARAIELGIGFGGGWPHVVRTREVQHLPFVVLAAACTVPAVAVRWLPALDLPAVPGRRISLRLLLGWIGLVWLAVLASLRDHSALRGTVEPELAVAKALHLIGVGSWIGVLVVALAVGGNRDQRISALAALKRPAMIGLAMTVGSGLLLAGGLVVSITGLLSTAYGWLLVVKLVLIPVAIVCGVVASRRGPRFAVVEGAVLGAVVASGALMATAGPAVDHQFLPIEAEAPPMAMSAQADDLLVRLRAVPGRPGPNTLEVQVSNTRRPAPAELRRLEIGVGGSDSDVRSAEPDASGLVMVPDVNLPVGETDVSITIDRAGWTSSSVVLQTRIEAAHYHAPVVVSSRPVRGSLRSAGVVTLGIAAMVFGAGHRRARRREGHECVHEPTVPSVS